MLLGRRKLLKGVTGLLLCVTSWSLASAPWSNDDFGYHVVNIWCIDGFDDGSCSPSPAPDLLVPSYYPNSCYFKNLGQPARCRAEVPNSEGRISTIESNYQQLHMWTMHRFVGESGEKSILRMRLFNGGLFVLLILLMLFGATARIAKAGVIAIALSLVPVGLWYVTSTSPTGWTVIATATGWSFAATLPHLIGALAKGRAMAYQRWACISGLILSSIVAYGSRKDGAVIFTVVVLAALMSGYSTSPRQLRRLRMISWKSTVVITSALAVFVAPRFFPYAGDFLSQIVNGTLPVLESSRRGDAFLWFTNWVTHYPYLYVASLGAEPMGSQELLRVPALVWLITVLIMGAVVVRSLQRPAIGQVFSLIPFVLGFVAALWFAGREFDLYNVPPRYVLPLLPACLGIIMNSSNAKSTALGFSSRSQLTLAALTLGHALSLFVVLERYTAGSSGGLRSIPVRFDERWFNWPIGPNFILLTGSIGWWMFLRYTLQYIEIREIGRDSYFPQEVSSD